MWNISSRDHSQDSTLRTSRAITRCIQAVSKEFFATEERERHRLAMELHDYLAQLLVVTKMHLAESRQENHSGSGNGGIQKAEALIDQALAYVHSLIVDLYPKTLYEKGLPYALESLFQKMREVGLQVDLQHDPLTKSIPLEQSIFLFRSIRELLFNVIKHAGVKKALVSLGPGPRQHIKVTVEDKGKGFDPRTISQDSGKEKFGLSEIHKKAEALGVQFALKSAPGEGTCVTFSIPRTGKRKTL